MKIVVFILDSYDKPVFKMKISTASPQHTLETLKYFSDTLTVGSKTRFKSKGVTDIIRERFFHFYPLDFNPYNSQIIIT